MRWILAPFLLAACSGSWGSNDLFEADGAVSQGGGEPDGSAVPGAGVDPGVSCGAHACAVGSEICCATNALVSSPSYSCRTSASQCGGTPIACDDAADCGGLVCCGRFDPEHGYRSISCMASCSGTLDGEQLVRFCDPNAHPDECAAQGGSCRASSEILGLYRCES